mgnify:CR=1 FL=1
MKWWEGADGRDRDFTKGMEFAKMFMNIFGREQMNAYLGFIVCGGINSADQGR